MPDTMTAEGLEQADGTSESQASDAPIQSSGFTEEQLNQLGNLVWNVVERQVTPLHQRAALTLDRLAVLDELREQGLSTRKALAVLDHVAAATGTAEELAAVKSAAETAIDKEQVERDKKAMEDARRADTVARNTTDPQVEIYRWFAETKPYLVKKATGQGLKFDDVTAHAKLREMPVDAAGRPDRSRYLELFDEVIEALADEQHKEQQTRVRADTTTPSGSSRSKRFTLADVDNVDLRHKSFKQLKAETTAMLDQMYSKR